MLNQDYQLRTLARGLDLLKSIEAAPSPLTLTELAALMGEPTPAVFRILKTLEANNYVVRDLNKRYSLPKRGDGLSSARGLVSTLRLLSSPPGHATTDELVTAIALEERIARDLLVFMEEVGLVQPSADDVWTLAPSILSFVRPVLAAKTTVLLRPLMERLREETKESVALFVRSGTNQVLIDLVPSREPIRYVVDVGTNFPLHTGAAGKAALASMSQEEIDTYLLECGAEIDRSWLREEVRLARSRGFATSIGERVFGAAAVATSLRDVKGQGQVVLNILGPEFRFTPELQVEHGARLAALSNSVIVPAHDLD